MLRVINTALLLAALCGALFALRAERTRRQLSREHRRLAAKVGFLSLDDEHKVHVQALPTGDPLHFAWQIYFPAGYEAWWDTTSVYGNVLGFRFPEYKRSQAFREIIRVRFRKVGGTWRLWSSNAAVLSRMTEPAAQMLEHPERLHVEQLGSGESKVGDVDQLIEIIRITSSEAAKDNSERPLLLVQFGTPQAWDKEKASGAR